MKKTVFILVTLALISMTACNSSSEESGEAIFNDSIEIKEDAPVTEHVDSVAADTVKVAPETKTEKKETKHIPPGVQSTSETFIGANGEKVKATYLNNDMASLVSLEIGDESPRKLMQTEAWAKGAEYSDGKIKWRVEGDAATLTKDGKATKFTVGK